MQDREVSNGCQVPRILSLDAYFTNEVEKVEKDPDTGRRYVGMCGGVVLCVHVCEVLFVCTYVHVCVVLCVWMCLLLCTCVCVCVVLCVRTCRCTCRCVCVYIRK